MMQAHPGLFDEAPRGAPQPVPLTRQADRIAQILLGKRGSLERYSAPGRHKWPDNELERLREAIVELEAVHETLLDLCAQERVAA